LLPSLIAVPLSDVTTTSVFSSSPRSSRLASIRARWRSARQISYRKFARACRFRGVSSMNGGSNTWSGVTPNSFSSRRWFFGPDGSWGSITPAQKKNGLPASRVTHCTIISLRQQAERQRGRAGTD
jgi:hypothetical protein